MLQLNFEPFPTLETERLLLRKVSHADAEDLFLMRRDLNVMRYIDRPIPTSIDDIHELLGRIMSGYEKNEAIAWAVTLKGVEKLIGMIGYHRIYPEHYRAEIGYQLVMEYWNKGIMNEAAAAVIAYGFHGLNYHSIEANVNPENTASIRLLEKNNFKREAYFRENYFFNGKFIDTAIYSLINPH
jgi:[ribosomal protein S5]-alanine N-acetyltransferase